MIEWPEKLVDSIARRRSVLFLESRYLCQFGKYIWKETWLHGMRF